MTNNNDLISAKKAKEIIENAKYKKAIKQWNELKFLIEDAINNGNFNITFNGYLEKCNRENLEKLGYVVSISSQYNEAYTSISWY